MNKVHFIDTSVLTNLLNVPGKNERYNEAKKEYEILARAGDSFVLPIAVLVETGNHIAHASNGSARRDCALKLVTIVEKAIKAEDNWNIVPSIPVEVMSRIMEQFPDKAMAATGFGDVSIVEQFEEYWKSKQPIGEMRIWSFDMHLSSYSHTGGLSRRKDR